MFVRLRARCRLWLWAAVAAADGACWIVGVRLAAIGCGAALLFTVSAAGVRRALGRVPRHAPRGRSGRAVVWAAAIAWVLAGLSIVTAPAASATVNRAVVHLVRPLGHAAAHVLLRSHVLAPESTVADLLVAGALITSVLAIRAVSRPVALPGQGSPDALLTARAVVEEHGDDSLSPFVPRPDKSFEFAEGGVLAYRVFGDTAVVSGDPVGPDGSELEVLGQLVRRAHRSGLRVVMYGCSARHLDRYRGMGLRAVCVGEEAVVDPTGFTLEGRAVRKLRQSVHRIERRGWRIEAREGREIDAELEAEVDAVERAWRSGRDRMIGFAMGMGDFDPGVRSGDLYLLAWSPDGELHGVMRFLAHRGKLSLDTMRRVGETPNGLNEALVCRALEFARSRDINEVSLNYAGLGHLVRRGSSGNLARRTITRVLVAQLGRHFQMDRLVAFNEKFSPEWRPRHLVFESRGALPRSVFRVLQAEGYLPEHRQPLASRAATVARQRRRLTSFTTRIHDTVSR